MPSRGILLLGNGVSAQNGSKPCRGMRYLLDTNIILLHLQSGFLETAPHDAEFFISTIVEAEVLRYPGLSEKELRVIEELLEIITSIDASSSIARRAAALGRTRPTKLPDLLIAAIALELAIPLVTKNLSDFKGIPDLIVQDNF